jgi:acetoacetyl-CoA synthetase
VQQQGTDERVVLFVVLRPGVSLSPALETRIRAHIRTVLSPKHVPAAIVQVPAVPVNANFKKMELLVKRVISGQPMPDEFPTLQNPECLEAYRAWARSAPAQPPSRL